MWDSLQRASPTKKSQRIRNSKHLRSVGCHPVTRLVDWQTSCHMSHETAPAMASIMLQIAQDSVLATLTGIEAGRTAAFRLRAAAPGCLALWACGDTGAQVLPSLY